MNSTTVDVTLRVVGVDLDSPETGDVLATQFPTVVWEEHGDLITATITLPREQVMTQADEIARRMEGQIPGAKVEGVFRDFVNATDIANRVSLSREAVRKWSAREDFPAPHSVVGGDSMKIWAWTQVVEWLWRARGIDMGESLLTSKQMTQLENCLMRNPDHTTTEWHTVPGKTSKAQAQAVTVFQPAQRGSGQRVVIDATSGRGHSSTDERRSVVVAAGRGRF